jgi:UDP-N-acetylglucosamine:LPS N-acetylglucosamine transferase
MNEITMDKPKKILAVASGGGHWVQLLRLRTAFQGCETVYVSTTDEQTRVPTSRFYRVPDANQWDKIGLVRMTMYLVWIILKEQPDIVISTGAAPGYVAIRFGKLLRARTIWVDSFANVDTLSMSGRMVGRYADLWLTQWSHLAKPDGPHFAGTVT